MTAYIALLRKDQRSDYGVDFPDFPGCITAGRTLEEARRMAEEALAFHVDGMRQDGEPIPPPSPMDVIMTDRRNRNAVAFLVDLPAQSRRAVRINVSLPEDVVQSIDRVSANRSGFLAEAARERLKRQRKSP
jgi:predicted RNase H-like HicB family nuclease